MTIFSLLSLPKTSDGLTALRPTTLVTSSLEDGSASPTRKVARLASDSDSASAFRSKQPPLQAVKSGPIQIKIVGDYSTSCFLHIFETTRTTRFRRRQGSSWRQAIGFTSAVHQHDPYAESHRSITDHLRRHLHCLPVHSDHRSSGP